MVTFMLLGCKNPIAPETEPEAGEDSATTFTAKDLLENLPESITAFETMLLNSNARDASSLPPVDFSTISPCSDDNYAEFVSNFSVRDEAFVNSNIAGLKNKASKIADLDFDKTFSLANTGFTPVSFFGRNTAPGSIKISRKEDLVKIYFTFDEYSQYTPEPNPCYAVLQGTFKNGKYETLTYTVFYFWEEDYKKYLFYDFFKENDAFYAVRKVSYNGQEASSVLLKNNTMNVYYQFGEKDDNSGGIGALAPQGEENNRFIGYKNKNYSVFYDYDETNGWTEIYFYDDKGNIQAIEEFYSGNKWLNISTTLLNIQPEIYADSEEYEYSPNFYYDEKQDEWCENLYTKELSVNGEDVYIPFYSQSITDYSSIDITTVGFSYKSGVKEKLQEGVNFILTFEHSQSAYENKIISDEKLSALNTEITTWADSLN